MKRAFYQLLVLVGLALLLASCGTSIPVVNLVPASVPVPSGSTLAVSLRGSAAATASAAAQRAVLHDGHFQPVSYNGDYTLVVQGVRDSQTYYPPAPKKASASSYGYNRPQTIVSCYLIFTLTRNGVVLDSSSKTYVGRDFDSEACYSAALAFCRRFHSYTEADSCSVDIDEDANPLLMKAAKYCKIGQWNEAYACATEAVAAVPTDSEALYLKALIEQRLHDYSKSDTTLRQAMAIEPKSKYSDAMAQNALQRRYFGSKNEATSAAPREEKTESKAAESSTGSVRSNPPVLVPSAPVPAAPSLAPAAPEPAAPMPSVPQPRVNKLNADSD